MKTVGKVFDAVEKVLTYLSGVMLVVFTMLTLLQVILRYVFNMPLSWSEQLSRYLFIWMLMFYMPVIMRKSNNLGFDLLVNRLPKKGQDIFWIVCESLIGGFAALYCYYSIALCIKFSKKVLVGLGIKANWVYSAQIIGAFFLCLFALELVINRVIRLKDSGKEGEAS